MTKLFFACLAASAAFGQDALTKFSEHQYAIKTLTGYYLTAENGGGAAVNSDRTQRGPWETFVMSQVSPGVFTFKSEKGTFLADSSMGGRGGGGGNRGQNRGGLSANRRQADAAAQFKIVLVNPEGPVVALMTSSGKYVTAENSGGVKTRGPRAIATDRAEIGEWELFYLERVN